MGRVHRVLAFGIACAASAGALPAFAAVHVLVPAGQTARVPEASVALSVSSEQSTSWLSLRLAGPSPKLALVIPLPAGSAVDRSSTAWFEALELATAPRIALPAGAEASCRDPDADPLDDTARTEHEPALAASELAVLDGIAELTAFAGEHELELTPQQEFSIAGEAAARWLVLSYG